MSGGEASPLRVNGWSIFAHPLLLDQLESLIGEVERRKLKNPGGYGKSNAAKRLAAIHKLAFEAIPQNPARPEYRQGAILGAEHKHWFRAKFFQQYRLFFRYHTGSRIIVYAWVNDADTLRAYASSDDAYRVFRKMLDRGYPPNSWEELEAQAREATPRLGKAFRETR